MRGRWRGQDCHVRPRGKCEYINANNIHQQTTIFSNILRYFMVKTVFYFTKILIDCWSFYTFSLKYIFQRERIVYEYKTRCEFKIEITKELKPAGVFVVVVKNWSISHLRSVSLYIFSANPPSRNVLLLWKIIVSDTVTSPFCFLRNLICHDGKFVIEIFSPSF